MRNQDLKIRAGRRRLLLVAAIFAAPIVLAILLNSGWLDYHPAPKKNRGTLVQPPIRVPTARAIVTNRGPRDLERQATQWWLVAVEAAADCKPACRRRLDELRRLRLAMGRRIRQVPVLVLTKGAAPGFSLSDDDLLWQASAQQNAALVDALRSVDHAAGLLPGQRFIINLGWIMMAYSPDQPNTDVLKDLQILTRTRQ